MSQLIQLRNQARKIKTTRKITYAMRLIAMSLYSKLEKQHRHVTYYQQTLNRMLGNLQQHTNEWSHPALFPTDPLDTTPLVIVIASSKGLCGGFNANLFRYIKRTIFFEEHQTPSIITIGTKARSLLRELALPGVVLEHIDTFTSNNFIEIADRLSRHILRTEQPYSSVMLYSNLFKNFFAQQPHKNLLIPYQAPAPNYETNTETGVTTPIWEQPPITVVTALAERYVRSSLIHLLFNSLLAEQSARFLAMDQATTNATKAIDKLTLKYNKARQALITREIAELTAGLSVL